MAHDYESSKKTAYRIISILAVITVGEVGFALIGKGYVFDGVHVPLVFMGGVMIILSIVKAYLIVYEFMHMKYEVPGMVKSVMLPTFLLVWAIIAFLWEGSDWNHRRTLIKEKNELKATQDTPETGMIYHIPTEE